MAAAAMAGVVVLVDPEAVEQPVIDGVGMGDPEPGPHHPGVDDVDLRGVELDGLAVQLGAVVDGRRAPRMPGRVDQVGEHPVLVLELATRLLLGLDPHVQPLDEIAVGDVRPPEVGEPAHIDGAGLPAGAQDLRGLPQGAGHAHLPGEPVARAPGQDPHRRQVPVSTAISTSALAISCCVPSPP